LFLCISASVLSQKNYTQIFIPAPAFAGIISSALGGRNPEREPLDSRLHGNDERNLCIDLFGTQH